MNAKPQNTATASTKTSTQIIRVSYLGRRDAACHEVVTGYQLAAVDVERHEHRHIRESRAAGRKIHTVIILRDQLAVVERRICPP